MLSPHLEPTLRLPLTSFPPGQRSRIHADLPGRFFLRKPEELPTLDEVFSPTVGGGNGLYPRNRMIAGMNFRSGFLRFVSQL